MRDDPISRRELLSLLSLATVPAAVTAGSVHSAKGASRRQKKQLSPDQVWTPERLGDQVWLHWSVEDLAVGASVSVWGDRKAAVTATQPDPSARPQMTREGLIFEPNQRLLIAHQNRAYLAHRAVVVLFRLEKPSTESFDSGSLVYFNGIGGGSNARQPMIGYRIPKGGPVEISAEWRDVRGSAGLHFLTEPNSFEQWHCIVSRRYDGRHYAALDGQPEFVVGDDLCLARGDPSMGGMIGDFRASGVRWAVDSILVLQGQLNDADAQRLMGWALWKRGAQSVLPQQHPYHTRPPSMSQAARREPYTESSDEDWLAIQKYWDSTDISTELEQGYRQPLDLSGYALVFEDHFTQMNISDEQGGPGPWWSPVHTAATGAARTVRLAEKSSVFTQQGSELIITMRKTGNEWVSGVLTSVNLNGHGHTWKYGYFEFRARASLGNGFAAWPAFWVKSVNEFFDLTQSRLEIDLYEGYNSDPKGHHQSYHNWPANRKIAGRASKHRYVGNYTGLKSQAWGGEDVNLFDDKYHTYGLMIDEQWVKFYFDGLELSRFPTPLEARQEVFILMDLALLPKEKEKASGEYVLGVDYVRVYQIR